MHCLFVLFVTAVCLFGINFEYILILADQNNLIKKDKHML